MSNYKNTNIYQNTVNFYLKISEICKNNNYQDPLIFEVEKATIKLTTEIAIGLDKNDRKEQNIALELAKEGFKIIKQLLDLCISKKILKEKIVNEIEEEIRILKNNLDFFIDNRPTILILSSIMGQGHMSASMAIKEGLEFKYGKNYDIVIIDFVEQIGTLLNKATQSAYEGSTKYIPNAYKFFFDSTDSKWQIKMLNIFNYPLSAKRIEKLFSSYHPSMVISTFPIWDYMASLIIKKTNCKYFLSVVTDSISIHSSWTTGNPDYHIVANEETAISLRKLGVANEKIKTLGFPVKLNFNQPSNKSDFLKSLHLNPHNFTLLFLPTAGKHQITIKRINEIKNDHPNLNIIVVCGRDKELYPRLLKNYKDEKNLRIIGWTNQMPSYIKNSDLILTKAGGATVMECIAAKKPMIITQVIPGQEMGNAILIKKHHLGIIQKESKMTLSECVEHIIKHKNSFQKNLNKISNPEASIKIAEFVNDLYTE
ncbi:hypothetical protein GF376_04240 [Candidatus Peregrinibacteria bacterium]|nr:hypothetical protein [Candidatus Peregrinibacteria bacterium]